MKKIINEKDLHRIYGGVIEIDPDPDPGDGGGGGGGIDPEPVFTTVNDAVEYYSSRLSGKDFGAKISSIAQSL